MILQHDYYYYIVRHAISHVTIRDTDLSTGRFHLYIDIPAFYRLIDNNESVFSVDHPAWTSKHGWLSLLLA
jgi:hypothetical protein